MFVNFVKFPRGSGEPATGDRSNKTITKVVGK